MKVNEYQYFKDIFTIFYKLITPNREFWYDQYVIVNNTVDKVMSNSILI